MAADTRTIACDISVNGNGADRCRDITHRSRDQTMGSKLQWGWLTILALVLAVAARGYAAELKIGGTAPKFSGLIGVDGKKHSLADYQDAKILVVVFTCNHCPVAQAYEDRLVALQKDYQGKGVQLVAVNVNNIPADRLDKMKERAKAKGFNFPYLYDATQKIGHNYGATVTPHVFVLDNNRKVAYMGAVDDSQATNKVKTSYLRNARCPSLRRKAAKRGHPTVRLQHKIRIARIFLVVCQYLVEWCEMGDSPRHHSRTVRGSPPCCDPCGSLRRACRWELVWRRRGAAAKSLPAASVKPR